MFFQKLQGSGACQKFLGFLLQAFGKFPWKGFCLYTPAPPRCASMGTHIPYFVRPCDRKTVAAFNPIRNNVAQNEMQTKKDGNINKKYIDRERQKFKERVKRKKERERERQSMRRVKEHM